MVGQPRGWGRPGLMTLALVPVQFVRDELHAAIPKAHATALMSRNGRAGEPWACKLPALPASADPAAAD
jgi:hypothetical protein